MQNSIDGLCRSLLCEVLEARPDLVQNVLPSQWEETQKTNFHDRSNLDISSKTINDALKALLTGTELYETRRFLFFIDGLDEYKETERRDQRHLVDMLVKWSKKSRGNLKLCVSSRENNIYMNSFSEDLRLRLHELTRVDIHTYATNHLGDSRFGTMRNELVGAIVSKAQGIFLWAILVVKKLRDRIEDDDDLDTMMALLEEVPSMLDKAFQHILDQQDDSKQKRAYKTLAILSMASRYDIKVSLLAYSFLCDYEKQKDFSICENSHKVLQKKIHQPNGLEEVCARAFKQLYGCCRGLVEAQEYDDQGNILKTRKRELDYTHRSIPEFFEAYAQKPKGQTVFGGFDVADALSSILWAEIKALNRAQVRSRSVHIRLAAILQMRCDAMIEIEPYRFISDMASFQKSIHHLEPPASNGANFTIPLGHEFSWDKNRSHCSRHQALLQLTGPEGVRVHVQQPSKRDDISIFSPLLTSLFAGDTGYFQKMLGHDSKILKSEFSRGLIARVCLMNGDTWQRLCGLRCFTPKTTVAIGTAQVSHRPSSCNRG